MLKEFDLIRGLVEASAGVSTDDPRVRVGPGDDLAVLRPVSGELLAGVDQVLDGVHFDLPRLRAEGEDAMDLIARKAVNRNLSDVAAMAALPLAVFAAVALPRDLPQADAQRLGQALDEAAASADYPCRCLGGDISVWDGPLTVSVTVLASASGVEPVLRTGARPGDRLFVTGALGNTQRTQHHLRFTPRLKVARTLASDPATRPAAMLDLSDGLGGDLAHLTPNALIQAASLPLRGDATRRGALNDGEDHELLFAVRPHVELPSEVEGVPLAEIGVVTAEGGLRIQEGGRTRSFEQAGVAGWEHGVRRA